MESPVQQKQTENEKVQLLPDDEQKMESSSVTSQEQNPTPNEISLLENEKFEAEQVLVPQPPKVIKEQNVVLKNIMLEHCYSRPHNWRPDSSFLRPTKSLFVPQTQSSKKRPSTGTVSQQLDNEDILDVESVPPEAPVIYDLPKAKRLMDECERHATFARDNQSIEDWEEKILRTNWTPGQNHLFNIMVNILNSDRMSRLAYTGVYNEPILRRTVVDKSVKRFRQLMSKYSWDIKLAQWLHQLLIDNLSTPYLAAYLDILQTLKHKLPIFVDKLLYGPSSHNRVGAISNESLFPLLKRPWDPVASSLNQDKPKKLPGNPVVIIVPSAPSTSATMYSKRLHRWINLFSNLATVCTVYNNIGTNGYKLTMTNCVDQMFAATRAKIQEIKAEYPNRPIVLAGFNAGSALALQVAQVESVLCILCLGFSVHTAEGNRGEPDDSLLELQCPVLFVIGQCANTALQEHLEDIRERMRVETGLLVVGSADDYLRVTKKKKRSEGITQSVVDRCIVDEVGEFVSGLLLSPYPPQIRQSPAHITPETIKRPKIERKRNNSNGSSLDSEPPSPTPRISRPGQNLSPVLGRPPGSKSKSKIEAKWHAMQQGIPMPILVSAPKSSQTNTLETSTTEPFQDNPKISPLKFNSEKSIKLTKASTSKSPQIPAKLQALGIPTIRNPYHGNAFPNLLQHSGVRTLPPNPTGKQIKVLDSISIPPSGTMKMVSVPGRSIDMSKMTILNSSNPQKVSMNNNYGNVMLLPDGKLKTKLPSRSAGSPAVIFSQGKTTGTSSLTPTSSLAKTSLTKYITSKKQLLANRSKLVKKMPYLSVPPPPNAPSNFPPPANLTSQDIMDLPIIFADDNQMLANNTMQPSDTPSSQILQSAHVKANTGKLVFLNKHSTSSIIKQNILKRPPASVSKPNPVKYTKIILSTAPSTEESKKNPSGITKPTSANIPMKELESLSLPMDIDLENELVATAITKPNFVPADSKNMSLIYKKSEMPRQTLISESMKRKHFDPDFDEDSDDPEYIPSKSDL